MLWRPDAVSDETITRVTLYLGGKTLLRKWGDANERRMGFIVRFNENGKMKLAPLTIESDLIFQFKTL